ncbi:hypothetical protein QuyetLC_26730 [Bacillus anthracis]|uniref:Type ISP restriction-modification enzyme LLaBIII C-terminal specificity domain-containing protein n=1 Tax=Bacillus anthracis TaxID=1392 RepID=A0A640MJE6_BACAN|nr:hypothetical protein QuyetLC_26730 [Bacillus anthracis]
MLVENYNSQVSNIKTEVDLELDKTIINWSRGLKKRWAKREFINYNDSEYRLELYRPFTKKWTNFLPPIIEYPGLWRKAFGNNNLEENLFLNFGSGERHSVFNF